MQLLSNYNSACYKQAVHHQQTGAVPHNWNLPALQYLSPEIPVIQLALPKTGGNFCLKFTQGTMFFLERQEDRAGPSLVKRTALH
jgi:hypothetical protein